MSLSFLLSHHTTQKSFLHSACSGCLAFLCGSSKTESQPEKLRFWWQAPGEHVPSTVVLTVWLSKLTSKRYRSTPGTFMLKSEIPQLQKPSVLKITASWIYHKAGHHPDHIVICLPQGQWSKIKFRVSIWGNSNNLLPSCTGYTNVEQLGLHSAWWESHLLWSTLSCSWDRIEVCACVCGSLSRDVLSVV